MRLYCILVLGMVSCATVTSQSKSIDDRVDELLSKMTLEEKIGQMNQYSSFYDATGPAPVDGYSKDRYEDIKSGLVGSMLNVKGVKQVKELQRLAVEESRLGIPIIFGFDVIHGFSTQSPIPIAESASWDLEAIENSARLAAKEAAASGLNWTFAPMVDISRDARWGRVMEGGGEDPYLSSKIAASRVRGFQGKDLSSHETLAATAKHFAAYGFAEAGRDYNTADVGLSTLYNVILPPFKAAVDAGVCTFMNSFNELNGIPATGDAFLQREILKGKWGFDGFVVSDWGSIMEMCDHGYARDVKHSAQLAANAGSDMDMESSAYVKYLKELVDLGKVDLEKVNDAARRILKVKFKLGLFDDPYKYCDEAREESVVGNEEQMEGALDMAKKSMVLLKNENNLLPLSKSGQKIALIGDLADDKNSPLGNWRMAAKSNTAISVLEGLKKYEGNTLIFENGVKLFEGPEEFGKHISVNNMDDTGIDEAVKVAQESDVVVIVIGEHGYMSGEGRSRTDIGLPGFQQQMLEAVMEVNKNVVLVLMNGRPLTIDWADEHVPAILEAWQPGTRSGDAIAQVIYGDYNPSGKLPMTFPRDVGQIPLYYNYKNSGRPGPKDVVFWSHYADLTNAPLYPFGYGLSYSTFGYSDLKILAVNDQVDVSVTVTNTSNVDGEEVVQLYIRDKVASITRPVKELKGFDKVMIKAGESKLVSFTLTDKELGFFNNKGEYIVEHGEFDIMVGGSSVGGLTDTFSLK